MEFTKHDVENLARLARIKLTDTEINEYRVGLEKIITGFEKIEQVSASDEIMISSTTNHNKWFEEATAGQAKDLLANAPHTKAGFIEVERVVND